MSASVMRSLSTDQVGAFVQLARHGSLHAAAEALFISEQGLRSRLLALERQIGVQLYYKSRGPRLRNPLTPQGHQFLRSAEIFLEQASHLCQMFEEQTTLQDLHVVASQYLIAYVLIDAVKRFHRQHPAIHVRLSARTEQEIEGALLEQTEISFGVAAPYEPSQDLVYRHLFSMEWSLITPRQHPLAEKAKARLVDIASFPLIIYERGSTGRRHVADAFQRSGLAPQIEMEATNTDLIVRMVEAGLGIGIVPLHSSGGVTRGRRVVVKPLGQQVNPIDSGILMRKKEQLCPAAMKLIDFLSPTSSRVALK